MSGTRNHRKPRNPKCAGPEPRIGRIEFNPAPDAEDRLRRLFTLLAVHFTGDDSEAADQNCLLASSPAKGGDE